jgi:hypothetical protein
MRLSYASGKRMFVDFCSDKIFAWVDRSSGEVHRDEVFVLVLKTLPTKNQRRRDR